MIDQNAFVRRVPGRESRRSHVLSLKLTVDEVAMLHWFKEFPGADYIPDRAIDGLVEKSLLAIQDGGVRITPQG